MKKIEEYTLKELKEMAKELEIKGRSKMNKTELYNAIKTVKDAEQLMSKVEAKEVEKEKEKQEVEKAADTNAKEKVNTKKEAEVRIWADVLRTMPPGTEVTVKVVDKHRPDTYFDTKIGRLKIGSKETEDGLPDAFVRTKYDHGRPFTYQIENNDKVHFYMAEREYRRIRYGGQQNDKVNPNKSKKAYKR